MTKAGEVVIEVRADTNSLEKDLKRVEQETNKTIGHLKDGTKIVLKSDSSSFDDTSKSIQQLDGELDDLIDDYIYYKSQLEQQNLNLSSQQTIEFSDSLSRVKEQIIQTSGALNENSQEIFEYVDEVAQLDAKLKDLISDYDNLKSQKIITEAEQEKMRDLENTIRKTRTELEKLSGQRITIRGIDDTQLNNTHTKSKSILKTITKWGLAIFGVRSAYMGIRQVMNSVLSQNKSLGDQMDAMKKSLYAAFTPIVEKIINLIRTLMAYVNYVWSRLFGKNLFSDKVAKDLKSGEKSAKEISKQLAGFDEANVLSSNKSSGGSAGGGTTDIGLANVKIPKWLEKIMDWVEKNPTLSKILFGLAPFVLFGMVQLGKTLTTTLISKLLGKAGAGATGAGASGLLGILGTMLLIAATVVICKITYDKVKEALQVYKELREEQERQNNVSQETANNNVKLDKSWVEEAKSVGKTTKEIQTYTSHIKNTIFTNKQKIASDTQSKESLKKLREENETMIATYHWLYEQGMLTEDQEKQYYEFLRNEMANGLDITNEKLGITAESFEKLDTKYKTQYEVEIKTKGKEALERLNTMFTNPTIKKWLGLSTFEKIFNANGGIVNMPGRGVPINYAGEAGREGIIPMDNESQMQLLGQSIAKYVRIDNYINNYMDARKVNTILQKSANQERLANNG